MKLIDLFSGDSSWPFGGGGSIPGLWIQGSRGDLGPPIVWSYQYVGSRMWHGISVLRCAPLPWWLCISVNENYGAAAWSARGPLLSAGIFSWQYLSQEGSSSPDWRMNSPEEYKEATGPQPTKQKRCWVLRYNGIFKPPNIMSTSESGQENQARVSPETPRHYNDMPAKRKRNQVRPLSSLVILWAKFHVVSSLLSVLKIS